METQWQGLRWPLIGSILFTLILVFTSRYYYITERDKILEYDKAQANVSFQMIKIQLEHLLHKGNYQDINPFVERIVDNNPNFLQIKLASSSGVTIAHYSRQGLFTKQLETEYTIPYSYRGMAHLLLKWDSSYADKEIVIKLAQTTVTALLVWIINLFFLLLYRRRLNEVYRLNDRIASEEIVSTLLRISKKGIPLKTILRQSLETVFRKPAYKLLSKGSIFLMDSKEPVLKMSAQIGMEPSLLKKCDRVPIGSCICGRAAQSRKLLHLSDIDDHHDHSAEGMEPHGHYCIPIMDKEEILGLLNIYVPSGHQRNQSEDRFMQMVADTLAIIIARWHSEQALRNNQERFSLIMQGAGADGLWDWNRATDEVWFSPRWKSMLGYAEDEIGDELQEWLDRIHPDDLALARSALDGCMEGVNDNFHHVIRIQHKEGRYMMTLCRGLTVRDKQQTVTRIVGTQSDITALQEAEQLLAVNQAKDEFLASMSHELRTPLASIIGNSELLIEQESSPDKLELIQSIERAGRRQLALINDILDMSKIESGMFSIDETPYNLELLLNDLETMFQVKARDRGIRFSVEHDREEPFQLLGDAQRIGQILINLIGNAIKFTEQGEVTLRVWSDSKELFYSIEDTGIGMSQATIDNLFGRFEQADGSISKRFGGSGLGLYISKNLAHMMRGEIDVSSEERKGSTFQLRIPYRPTDTPAVKRQANDTARPALQQRYQASVLVAEDAPELQLLESKLLQSMGITVTLAQNGKEAIELVATNHFDLILMDMQMPEMDGIEATRALRQQGITTPIVPLTANAMQKHRDAFSAEGCEDFLTKPIDRQELKCVLNRYLVQGKEQKTLDKLNIENRRKKERRSEEIATIDDDRSTDTPRRLQDKIDHVLTTPPHAAVEEEVDDELMAIFFDSSTKNRDKLNAALSNKEWSEVRATVHTIKGSAASFGYPELSKMAETVQLAIDQERLDEVPALAMALVRSIGEIIP